MHNQTFDEKPPLWQLTFASHNNNNNNHSFMPLYKTDQPVLSSTSSSGEDMILHLNPHCASNVIDFSLYQK